jgi:UDP-N-acetylglucosamine kinase
MDPNGKMAEAARAYIRAHKRELIAAFADRNTYPSVPNPVSIFMAGSPGAGKTEFSKQLLKRFKSTEQAVRIDADDIRAWIPGYAATDAVTLQGASSLGVEKLQDYCLEHRQNLILDGTFADLAKAIMNIDRSIRKNRLVEIYYLYQDPLLAWNFTKRREALERRHVPKSVFIQAFLSSRINVNDVKNRFGSKVRLTVIEKNFANQLERFEYNVKSVDTYVKSGYTEGQLNAIL